MANIIDKKINPEIPIVQESNRNEVYLPSASYTNPGIAGYYKTHFIVDNDGIVHLRKAPERAVSAVTYDSNSNTLSITFDDKTVETIKLNDCACISGIDMIVYDTFTVVNFEKTSWHELSANKVLVITAAQTGYNNDELICQLDKYNVVNTNVNDGVFVSNYQSDNTYQIYKCTDGSIAIFANDTFAGRFIILKREFAVQKNVANITYNDDTGVLTVYYITGGSKDITIKLNIENGTGIKSLNQVQDGTTGTFDFTNKNPNATAIDSTLTGQIAYGGQGAFATSFGGKSSAQGKRSFACGTTTIAKGDYSFASGDNSVALGTDSHAEGTMTTAVGYSSHAEGNNTITKSQASHAEGNGSKAYGLGAHAEGNSTLASADNSHSEGDSSQAQGKTSHAEGYSTTASATASHAEGYQTKATVDAAHAEGYATTASGNSSHAEGYQTKATVDAAHAEGYATTASGNSSHAEGSSTTAIGSSSHAEGYKTTAKGANSHTEGTNTKTQNTKYEVPSGSSSGSGTGSSAAGGTTEQQETYDKRRGENSHAEGNYTIASGYTSHAEGSNTVADGHMSHAEGEGTLASGYCAHTEGQNNTASGLNSHAEGFQTTASGFQSHAEGIGTVASHSASHAGGLNTKTGFPNQTVIGTCNIGKNNTVFEVGNGTLDTNRKNAFEVLFDGRAKVQSAPTENDDVVRLGDVSSIADPAEVVNSTTSYTTLDAIAADVLANPGKVLRVAYTLVSTSIISPPSGLNYGSAYYLFRALANPTEIASGGEPTVGVIEVTFENVSTATTGMRPFGYLRKGYAGSLTKWWWSSWSTNAFQQTLISGSNIKTVGGTSLLSSGNISFKTINSNSIIGSGNIAIEGGALYEHYVTITPSNAMYCIYMRIYMSTPAQLDESALVSLFPGNMLGTVYGSSGYGIARFTVGGSKAYVSGTCWFFQTSGSTTSIYQITMAQLTIASLTDTVTEM